MKLNGFQSKNVEEEKIIPRLTAAKPNFVINIAPDTPLERLKVSPHRKSCFLNAGQTYCCAGYVSADGKSYLIFDMGSGNICTVDTSAATIKPLDDNICLNNIQLQLKTSSKGWKYVPKK